MAFNPFEAFSIRSKLGRSVMAILGIVVMLTFVLSTGAVGTGNDFFDQIGKMFGGKGSGEVLATAYGDDIREADMAEVRRQRLAAREYLANAVESAYSSWAKSLEQDINSSRLSSETKRDIERFVKLRVDSDRDRRQYINYLMNDIQRFGPEVTRLSQAATRARSKPESEDKKAMDAVAAIIMHDLGETPFILVELGESDRDTLDFMLLLKKADQLGINYSKDEVLALVSKDTLGRLGNAGASIERRMRESGRFGDISPAWLIEAIGNEYRARAALSAIQGLSPTAATIRQRRDNSFIALILGVEPGTLPLPGQLGTLSAMPGQLTPYEFFEFYKDRCSEHTFAMLEIPAENFMDKVTGEPTAKEREDLFKRYRGELPDPSKERPGFKEPRKLKIEFATLDANAPRITQAIPKLQAASLFLCATAGAMTLDPASALASTAHPGIAETLPIREAVSEKMQENLSAYKPIEQWDFTPRDTSIYRPQPIVSALGILAGNPDITTFAAATASVHQHVERFDHQTRVPFLLQAWLTPFSPTMGNALGMPAFAYALNPKLPPEGLYLAQAIKTAKTKQRRELFQADVRALEDKLAELMRDAGPSGKGDKAKIEKGREEAKKHLETWLKDRGLTASGTKTPIDELSVSTNPDLKPLNDVAKSEPDGTNSLSKMLFEMTDPRSFGMTGAPFARTQPFRPQWFPAEPVGEIADKPNHLVWVSEDTEARIYNSLENADRLTNGEMTRRVDRAWKLQKARALAKAEAERLAGQVREIAKAAASNPTGVDRQLRDLALENKLRLINLPDMALLKLERGATQARMEYQTPKIEKDQVLYPTADFAEQLLELRKEPVGSVTVVADAPKSRYYVACEVARLEKTVEEFRDVFARSAAGSNQQDLLYERFALPEERGQALVDVFARLRADAKLEETEAFKNREKKEGE
jgi:hypothetical protein